MFKATLPERWKTQSPRTRIAGSVAFALATILSSYALLDYAQRPSAGEFSLIALHAWMYQHFESQAALHSALTASFIAFAMFAQTLIALACIPESRRAGSGKVKAFDFASNTAAVLLVSLLGFSAVLGLSWAGPSHPWGDHPNLMAFSAMAACVVLSVLLLGIGVGSMSRAEIKNPVYAFARSKLFFSLAFFAFGASILTSAMLLGMFLLDYLLSPVGQPAPSAGEDAAPE